MNSFAALNRTIGDGKVFIIAEIGQNHQGDLDLAKKMILSAKENGADCVKFQKSCLSEKFTRSALERLYVSENAWGKTYGEHKEYLEFSIDQYKELQDYANTLDIIFTASAMDTQSLNDLFSLNVPIIKIGSGDANNIALIVEAASKRTPLIISTGMQSEAMVRRIVSIMKENSKTNYSMLHCVSSYPTQPEYVNLRMLDLYAEWFPDICLGYSGHEQGILISVAAVLLGAKVIERHFTMDKMQKGTDHKLSLEPNEFGKLTAMIRTVERYIPLNADDETILEILRKFATEAELNDVQIALRPITEKRVLDCEMECRNKLGKSIVYRRNVKSGSVLTSDTICVKVSEPFGISAEKSEQFIGRILCKNVFADENLSENHFISDQSLK